MEMKSEFEYGKDDSMDEDDLKLVIKEEALKDDEEEEEEMNNSQASSCDYNLSQFKEELKTEPSFEPEQEDSDEDMPLVRKRFFYFHGMLNFKNKIFLVLLMFTIEFSAETIQPQTQTGTSLFRPISCCVEWKYLDWRKLTRAMF